MMRRSIARHDDGSHDTGMTFVEVLVTFGVLSLIATVIGVAVSVIFRSETGVADVVGESHNVQQAVNYFHLDVESGPATEGEYKWVFGRGTGCSDGGDENVLQFDTSTDGAPGADSRIAYRLTPGQSADLDRYECDWNGSAWVESSVVNIADRLDNSGGNAVTVNVAATAGVVDRVEMTFAQSNTDNEFSASPRAETGLAAVGIGTCSADVLTAMVGFGGLVEGDVFLNSGEVDGTLAVGGSFGWNGNGRTVGDDDSNNTNGFPNVTLYAKSIDWAYSASAGPMVASDNASDNIILTVPPYVVLQGNPDEVYESSSVSGPRIEVNKNADVFSTTSYPLDFTAQFDELRACSEALANLPAGADAGHAAVSGTQANLHLTPPASGNAVILNISEAYLSGVTQITDGLPLGKPKPLIVNIGEDLTDLDDDIVFDIATPSWTSFGNYKRVLYNFTNLEGTVTVAQDLYGTIFAPFASVITNPGVDVHGAVIAKTWTHNGGSVENDSLKLFNATINWN